MLAYFDYIYVNQAVHSKPLYDILAQKCVSDLLGFHSCRFAGRSKDWYFNIFISCDDKILDALKSLSQSIPSFGVCSKLESVQIENSHWGECTSIVFIFNAGSWSILSSSATDYFNSTFKGLIMFPWYGGRLVNLIHRFPCLFSIVRNSFHQILCTSLYCVLMKIFNV